MGIADTGKNRNVAAESDARCTQQIRRTLMKSVRMARRSLEDINRMLSCAPGGAQGVADELTTAEYTEVTTMVDTLEAYFAAHKFTGDKNVTVTVPTQTP